MLTKEQEQQVKTFYAPYKTPSMVFHRYFTSVSGEFYPEYIPQDIYVGDIDPYFNDIIGAKYLDNKCYYSSLFHGIAQPCNLLRRVNNIWLDGNDDPVRNDDIRRIVEKSGDGGLFLKEAQTSSGGHGVKYIPSKEVSAESILKFADAIKTDVVVQKELHQHASMARLNASSVNSLRIYSVLQLDGEVTIYSAVVRMGVGNTKLDNYSAGGMTCGIKPDGTLRKYGYNKAGEKTEHHPSSGVTFDGYAIPSYQEAVKLVKKAHPMISHYRSVSWDIAIVEDGTPVLIEANLCRGGIDLLQLNNGPLYGKDTKKILDEVFRHN